MSHKIIKPEGIELIEYLNNGYAICNRCGAVMIYLSIVRIKDGRRGLRV